jgi:hypothetical protein
MLWNDVSRCTGMFDDGKHICALRDKCSRYLTYKYEFIDKLSDAEEDDVHSIMYPPKSIESDECNMYIPFDHNEWTVM